MSFHDIFSNPIYVIIIAVGALLLICCALINIFAFCFIKKRLDFTSAKVIPIKYLPDPPVIIREPNPEVPPIKLTKRIFRRVRMRWVAANPKEYVKPDRKTLHHHWTKHNISHQKRAEFFYKWLCCISFADDDVDADPDMETGQESSFEDVTDVEDKHGSSIKNKRPRNSQKNSTRPNTVDNNSTEPDLIINDIEEEEILDEGIPDGASLLDLDPSVKTKLVLQQRKDRRRELHLDRAERGEVDVVAINSGPPVQVIPSGFEPTDKIPRLNIEDLQFQRIMFLWEEKEANGWYNGTVSGVSRKKDCNFSVKYDKFESKNVYVDGIKNYNLTMSGDNAYGKRWIVLKKKSTA